MKKYAYTETRRIEIGKLRAVCIKENWFDAGTNEEYASFFEMARYMDNVTVDELVELATVICEHTSRASVLDDEFFCNMLYILAKDTCYSYFDFIG